MAGSVQLGGPRLFEKPRYRHEVLVGNWYEDRALRDYNNSAERFGRADKTDVEQKTCNELTSGKNTSAQGFRFPPKYDSGIKVPEFPAVSTGDLHRGYYSTTYKRSYGPRPSYVHYTMASYLKRTNQQQPQEADPQATITVPSESDREILVLEKSNLAGL